MNAKTYNASVSIGVLMTAAGAGAQWGWPVGLMVAGALVLALTVATLQMMARGR